MKKVLVLLVFFLGLTTIQYAEARGGGGSSKSSGGRYKGIWNGDYGSSDSSSDVPAPLPPPTYSGVAKRKAGLRTCESKYCKVVTYLPKGSKVQWYESKDGFIHLYDSPYWISSLDLKK